MAEIGLKNIAALTVARRLNESTGAVAQAMERLSTGLRINHATDDAAGLAVATGLSSSARIYTQAIRNINDGLSYMNIADGALTALSSITNRQIELAEEAANGTYSAAQRRAMTTEANALVDEYNRIVQTTDFNGMHMLDPLQQSGLLAIQVGAGANGTIALTTGTALARLVGDGTLQVQSSYATSTSNRGVYSIDVNGDGKLDIVASGGGAGILFYAGHGDGTFSAAQTIGIYGPFVDTLSFGDVNNDGKLDMFAQLGGAGQQIYLGNGDGTFIRGQTFAPTGARGVISDLNGDGKADLVSVSNGSTVNIALGNGDGTFKVMTAQTVNGPQNSGVSAGDINGDGIQDLLVTSYQPYNSANTSVLLGNGDGSFRFVSSFVLSPLGTENMLIDVNNDGRLDLIQASRDIGAFVGLGNGDGTFKAAVTLVTSSGGAYHLTSADFNGDGYLDVGVGSATAGWVFLSNGDGTFKAGTSAPTANQSPAVAAGDFNGDGAADLVTTGYSAGPQGLQILIADTRSVGTVAKLNLYTAASALSALDTLNAQLMRIENERALLGANSSRLSVALDHASVLRENYLAASSRITDADIPEETAELVRQQVLQQAATAVLAQANQQPAIVLKLLK